MTEEWTIEELFDVLHDALPGLCLRHEGTRWYAEFGETVCVNGSQRVRQEGESPVTALDAAWELLTSGTWIRRPDAKRGRQACDLDWLHVEHQARAEAGGGGESRRQVGAGNM